jgi:hypothetical protein
MSATLIAETIAALPIEPTLERLRVQGIRIPYPAEVRDYLSRYPDLLSLTRKVCELASAEFAGKATLSLEPYVDPEIGDRRLTLYVRQEPYDHSIWDGIERIRASYEDEIADLSGWLQVTVDFRAAGDE